MSLSNGDTSVGRKVYNHSIQSEYQSDTCRIQVLLPASYNPAQRYPVVYVLPVEAKCETRYGDGLQEVLQQNLQDKYNAIFVAPTFAQLPWYADHPIEAGIRQESHFIEVVIPFVKENYAVSLNRSDHLLLGFSKSGWGAWSLLLRHPEKFGKAVAWDAPLMMDQIGKYGNREIFGTQENFTRYQLTATLEKQADKLSGNPARLIHLGYGNFRESHQQMRQFLQDHKIPHIYRDGPVRQHTWHSGWVAEAVELLFDDKQPKD